MGSISRVLGPTWSFYNDTVTSLANHLGLHWIEWCGEFVILSFTSTRLPTWISDCLVFLALSAYALVFSFTLTSLYVAISMYLRQFCSHLPFNPLTPRSDQHVTSPYDNHMFSGKQLTRILKLIRKKFFILILHQILVTNLQGIV